MPQVRILPRVLLNSFADKSRIRSATLNSEMQTKICGTCKQEKTVSEFNKNRAKRDGLQSSCKSCKKGHQASWYQNNSERHIENVAKRKEEVRAWIREQKSVPCMDCGVRYPYYVMDFDHVEGEKEFGVSAAANSYGANQIREEIAKCEVVCSNCHRIRTHTRACNSVGRVADS